MTYTASEMIYRILDWAGFICVTALVLSPFWIPPAIILAVLWVVL